MMATAPKRPERYSKAVDRKLIALAKTMNVESIVKGTGRKPEAIIRTAKWLGVL